MQNNYTNFKVSDYLIDEFFIDSMLHPTTQSEAFWKILIDKQKIDSNEFISAFMILKDLHENKPTVFVDRIEKLKLRIQTTNRRNARKKNQLKFIRYAATVTLIVGIAGITAFLFNKNMKNESKKIISEFARENIVHTKDENTEIQIVSGDETFSVEGTQAKVEYDENGKLKVNKQDVTQKNDIKTEKASLVYNQLHVPYGKRAFLTLSDGTSLWVNTGSTVIYPTTFANDKREIFVEGEVFAEVTHEENRPFIVRTDKLDVRVLGTVFNITAYKEDNRTNVVLVSGSVNVTPQHQKTTVMKPNQLYEFTDKYSILKNVDVENYISWHNGIYIFKNEPIENILIRLSRYYNVTMSLPATPSGVTCSGKLELKNDLMQLLNGLSEITPLSFGVKANVYKIKFD